MSNLRSHLFVSHLFLLVVSLAVLTGVMLLFLSSSPAPEQLTWQRLEVMLPSLTRNIAQNLNRIRRSEDYLNTLDEFGDTNDVRVILATVDDNRTVVLHDSASIFSARDNLQLIPENNFRATRVAAPGLSTELIFGRFSNPNDSEWLYAGVYQRTPGLARPETEALILILAEQRTTKSLQAVLTEFGGSFLIPLVQAGLVGGIIAFLLAYVISQNIARPLQKLAQATTSVARGHFTEHVPESGPREVRSVAAAFNRMSAEVRSTQQSQRDFLANVSHDLKTPLTSIQGYSQAIIDGAAKDPAHAARIIYDEAGRLNRMVTELTDLARLQAGRLSMKMSILDISEIVEAIAYRLGVVGRKKDIQMTVQTTPMPAIAGDGDRLVQVFTNLISNAINYTPNGGEVRVRTQERDGGAEIRIEDTGIGIPPQELPRIFERFYQVDKSRGPRRGTGLGLAITKEIVEAHGGTIHIFSQGQDQGTTVTIWLPSPEMSTVAIRRVQ